MGVKHPTVNVLSTRTSKRGTAAVSALALVLSGESTCTLNQVTVNSVLMTVIYLVLHALVTVWAYDVFGILLANAGGVDASKLEAEVHVI